MIVEITASDEMKAAGYPDRAIDRDAVKTLGSHFTDDDLLASLRTLYGYPDGMLEGLKVIRLRDKLILRP